MKTVTVPLKGRRYEIRIGDGLLAEAGRHLSPLMHRPQVFVVSDQRVAALHGAALQSGLDSAGISLSLLALPPGEATKSWSHLERTVEWLIDEKVERDDIVLAFGGGVIGDLAGFAAAILRRGVRYVQIPTTLLAQVDSSVGGKTGINLAAGKNLVGSFHQPTLVLADTDLLSTLAERDFRAGYAEVAKYGLLGDGTFFGWLENNASDIADRSQAALQYAVQRACEMKSDLVVKDETERGDRALLNLGHTFGHALEAATGYSERLLHGEAVAIGCVLAFKLSAHLGLCPESAPARVATHLARIGLPTTLSEIAGALPDAAGLLELMAQDKKVRSGRIVFILASDVGKAHVARDVDTDDVLRLLTDELAARAA